MTIREYDDPIHRGKAPEKEHRKPGSVYGPQEKRHEASPLRGGPKTHEVGKSFGLLQGLLVTGLSGAEKE